MKSLLPESLKPYADLVQGVALAILIFVIGWSIAKWAERLVRSVSEKKKLDPALSRFFASLARYTLILVTVITALGAVGVQTTSFVAVFASAGLAIGLALQGNLGHFASGVMLLFFRPFTLEEFVEVAGKTGTVKDIGLFATTLHTPDNEMIIIPNGKVTGDVIKNFTRNGTRRAGVGVGVAYGSDVDQVKAILLDAVKKIDVVLEDPEPAVALTGLGASSVDFTILTWSNVDVYLDMIGAVKQAAYESLNAAGIEIPFNQIVVHQAPAEPAAVDQAA